MKFKITLTAKLPIQITKKAKWFVASCPALDVASQGETEEVAKKNIVEALTMFLRSCMERGTLDAVLKQCGLKSVVEQDQDVEPAESSVGQEYVDIPLHLLSQFEENSQCHHDEIDEDIIRPNMRTASMNRKQYFEYLEQCK